MSAIDITVFVAFVAIVIGVGLYKSKGEATHSEHGAANYFLAGGASRGGSSVSR